MSDTTLFPPGSQLRKPSRVPRAPVIEHEPKDDGANPWDFDKLGIHIIPGLLTWEKFELLWSTVDGIRQSSLFFVGDALNAGEAKFGERLWQIDVTGYRPETLRNAQWVARAFPVARRRRLPWSYHQACATSQLSAQEQDELLDMAEEKKRQHAHFTTKDLAAIVQEHIAAKNAPVMPTNGSDDLDDLPDPTDTERDAELVEDDEEETLAAPPVAESEVVNETRACIDAVRAIAAEMVNGGYDPLEARRLSNRVLSLVGRRSTGWASNVLQHSDIALSLVPPQWRLQIGGSYAVEEARQWEVKLYHRDGRRFVLANGPSLPCALTEAGLTAMLPAA